MRRMGAKQDRAKRARRQFTDDFKAGAVRLVLDEGKTVATCLYSTRDHDRDEDGWERSAWSIGLVSSWCLAPRNRS